MSKVVLEVMSPRAVLPSDPPAGLSAPRPETLSGKKFVFIPQKPACAEFFKALGAVISERYPGTSFTILPGGLGTDIPDGILDKCDVWLEGVKTTGGHRTPLAIKMEKAGKPGACITVDDFVVQRNRELRCFGMPTMRQVVIPAYDFFACETKPEKLRKIAEDNFGQIVDVLTRPLTDEEMHPKPFVYDYGNMVFEGDTYAEAFEKFHQHFTENELNDGLPVIPPTPEAVKWMLTGTSRDPDEVLGLFPPGFGKATVEKVAVNAVMAGAKPEYLPVILAAVECCLEPGFDFYHISTGSLASRALIVVNGPIAKEIGMNSGMGYLGPGCRANNAIGRAVNLCMINLGWSFFRVECGYQGQPERYTHLVFAEDEENSPWESYAVSRGFSPEDSVVFMDECTYTNRLGPGGGMSFPPLELEMQKMAAMLKSGYPALVPDKKRVGPPSPFTIETDIEKKINTACFQFALHLSFARQLHEAGFTKQSFAQWLCDQHRIPWEDFSESQQEKILEVAKKGTIPGLAVDDCRPGGTIPTINPQRVTLFVAGANAGQVTGFYGGGLGSNLLGGGLGMVCRKVTGATLTKAGR
ncbi:MAG: hypothetical protein GX189_04200 [Clostridiales bacterium]|mgnify:CR=1 FL=1|nr:hypothetical protein [Clostridiales bacterium]